jgi:hypothetical protein
MAARKKPRIGRPFKPPRGKRAQLTLLVRADIKREIDKAAQKNGRTQSQEAELWFETKLAYDAMKERMRMTVAEMEQQGGEVWLRHQGFTPLRTVHGIVWFPPNFPLDEWFKKAEEPK